MSGHVNYFYSDGKLPSHTKPAFTKHKILTIHSIIVKNALLLMFRIHRHPETLPISMVNLIHENAPIPGSDYESCSQWLTQYNTGPYARSFFSKGPLLFAELANKINCTANNVGSTKTRLKLILLTMQGSGDTDIWQSENLKLYNIEGLRRSERLQITPY